MRIAPPGWLPDARTEPEALIEEARRRQRRRWLTVGVAVAAVLASVAGVVAGVAGHPPGRPGPRSHPRSQVAARHAAAPAPIPPSIGTTLLMWPAGSGQCCGPVAVNNLSTGRLAQRQEPAIGAGDYQPLLTQAGRWLVYVGNGTTVIRDDLSGKPRVLGPTPFFAPAAAPGRVWLFQIQHGMQGRSGRGRWRSRRVRPAARSPCPPAHTCQPSGARTRACCCRYRKAWPCGIRAARPGSCSSSPNFADGFDATSRLAAYGTGCASQTTAPDAPQDPSAG